LQTKGRKDAKTSHKKVRPVHFRCFIARKKTIMNAISFELRELSNSYKLSDSMHLLENFSSRKGAKARRLRIKSSICSFHLIHCEKRKMVINLICFKF
jgi:hypothetical protein